MPSFHYSDTVSKALACLTSEALEYTEVSGMDEPSVVFRLDLENMVEMGLANLPLESLAVPLAQRELWTPLARCTQTRQTVEVGHRLTTFFPSFFVAALLELESALKRYPMEGYVVGGIARDIFLIESRKLVVSDVDVTLCGDAIAFAHWLTEHSKNFILVEDYPEFGTAKVAYKDRIHLDLASTRREIYHGCGRLPEVLERGVPLSEDLKRRDFTVNTLTLSLHELGKVFDYLGGIPDIEVQRIRVLHPASFYEDPSRIFRALKFAMRLQFLIEPVTESLIKRFIQFQGSIHTVYRGGGARIKESIKGLLSLPEGVAKQRGLAFFLDAQLFRLMHMADTMSWMSSEALLVWISEVHRRWRLAAERLPRLESVIQQVETHLGHPVEEGEQTRKDTWLLYLALFFQGFPEEPFLAWANQLGLTREEREVIEDYRMMVDDCRKLPPEEQMTPLDIYELCHDVDLRALETWILMVDEFDHGLEIYHLFRRRVSKIRVELKGKELLALGVPPGESVGQMLADLLVERIRGTLHNRTDEMQYVRGRLGLPLQWTPPSEEPLEDESWGTYSG